MVNILSKDVFDNCRLFLLQTSTTSYFLDKNRSQDVYVGLRHSFLHLHHATKLNLTLNTAFSPRVWNARAHRHLYFSYLGFKEALESGVWSVLRHSCFNAIFCKADLQTCIGVFFDKKAFLLALLPCYSEDLCVELHGLAARGALAAAERRLSVEGLPGQSTPGAMNKTTRAWAI